MTILSALAQLYDRMGVVAQLALEA